MFTRLDVIHAVAMQVAVAIIFRLLPDHKHLSLRHLGDVGTTWSRRFGYKEIRGNRWR